MTKQIKNKVCLYPFSRMEIGETTFVPCCASWLTEEYHKIDKTYPKWNGAGAQALRSKILEGDYSFCKRELCHMPLFSLDELKENLNLHQETPITATNFKAMEAGSSSMPEGPVSISVNVDPRCNLACPSCRTEHIFKASPQVDLKILALEHFLARHKKHIRLVKMAADGEVFFSPFLRNLLKSLHPGNYPQLDHVYILTNGLLANQQSFETLKPGTDFIKKISVSIDAGTKEVYERVRGGDWSKLLKNLEFLSGLRSQGQLSYLNFSFVVRQENFKTIPDFVHLAKTIGADDVYLTTFVPWNRMKIENYYDEAIHLDSHPKHLEFQDIRKVFNADPFVKFKIGGSQEGSTTS